MRIGIVSTTVALFLVLGVTAPVGAQKDKGDNQGRPEKQRQGQGKQQQHTQQQQRSRATPDSSNRAPSSSKVTPGSNSSTLSNSVSKPVGVHSKGDVCREPNSPPCGSSIAHVDGRRSTAPGNNVAATTATAFLNPIFVATLVRITGFASTATPCMWLAGFPAFSTAAFGSVSLTRGRNIGQTIGTEQTMYISTTTKTDITCTTAGIPAFVLQLTSS